MADIYGNTVHTIHPRNLGQTKIIILFVIVLKSNWMSQKGLLGVYLTEYE